MLCLKTLVSPKLHFKMCSLDSLVIKNADIQPDVKSAISPLILYSSQFWADHLVHTQSDEPSEGGGQVRDIQEAPVLDGDNESIGKSI